jgi:hypothetical protein
LTNIGLIDNIEEYILRPNNNFKYIGDSFQLLYKSRDRNYLYNSHRTKIVRLLSLLIGELKLEHPDEDIELHIDINPYILLDKEIMTFRNTFLNSFKNITDVIIVDIKEDIDFNNYDIVILYNALEILNKKIMSGLKIGEYSNVRLYTNYEIFNYKSLSKDKSIDIEELVNSMSNMLKHYINIELIPPGMFSIDVDNTKKENEE